jgi:murein DD-endopeptidase MepM/ murein hydrolase activator NlpD
VRGRIVLAAVAAGAFVAAGSTLNQAHSTNDTAPPPDRLTPAAGGGAAQAVFGIGGGTTPTELLRPQVLAFAKNEPSQLQSLAKGERIGAERAAREAAARRVLYSLPAAGTFTSGYGPRWGTMHWGIDIANRIGTPIKAAADGVVVESGPASGFGLWVRIEHADGTITVYGHIDRSLVREGQRVQAGQQIATMGNRGHSTGPHLHFEVWAADGSKINPLSWLRSRGLKV